MISTGLPFTLVLIVASFSVIKGVNTAFIKKEELKRQQLYEDVIRYSEEKQ